MPLIALAVVAGSAISAGASSAASKKNAQGKLDQERNSSLAVEQRRQDLINQAVNGSYQGGYSSINDGKGYSVNDIFGSKVNAVPGTNINSTLSDQNRQVTGQGIGNASKLASQVNRQVTADSLISGFDRARATTPGYDDQVASYARNVQDRLDGVIPRGLQEQLSTQAAERGAAGGTPGGSDPDYLKNFGLTSIDLQNQGANMFGQFQNTMAQMFPVQQTRGADQLLPYTSYSAQGRVGAALQAQQQAQLAAQIEAAPDPTAVGLFQAEMAMANEAGNQLNHTAPNNIGNAILGGVGQGVSAYGAAYGNQQANNYAAYGGQGAGHQPSYSPSVDYGSAAYNDGTFLNQSNYQGGPYAGGYSWPV